MRSAALLAAAVALAGPGLASTGGLDLYAVFTAATPQDTGPPFSCVFCLWAEPVHIAEFGREGQSERPLPAGEYFFAADLAGARCTGPATVRLDPEGGTWTSPVFVQPSYPAAPPHFEDRTGTTGPVLLHGSCWATHALTWDLVVLPLGTWTEGFVASVVISAEGGASLSDRDEFPAFG